MQLARALICLVLDALILVIILNFVLSLFPLGYGTFLQKVRRRCEGVLNPLLGSIRRVVPPVQTTTSSFDTAFIVLIAVLIILQAFICPPLGTL